MDCSVVQNNFNSLLKGTLSGNELRRTYYHIVKCDECREVLLDEFSFYTTFNDLDKDLDFNYEKKLNELLLSIKNNIENKDMAKVVRYTIYSILICLAFIVILFLALKLVYR